MTHPDITYAVNVVSQFMHAPRTTHMHSVKRIFRYLQGTLTYGLTLRASSPTSMVIAYSDADWADCPDSHHSTSGYTVFLGSNLISCAQSINLLFSNHLQSLSTGLLHTRLLRLVGFVTSFVSLVSFFANQYVYCVITSVPLT